MFFIAKFLYCLWNNKEHIVVIILLYIRCTTLKKCEDMLGENFRYTDKCINEKVNYNSFEEFKAINETIIIFVDLQNYIHFFLKGNHFCKL